MPDRVRIDYVCADCGAQAVSVPDPKVAGLPRSSHVVVPHAVGCATGIRAAAALARGLAVKR